MIDKLKLQKEFIQKQYKMEKKVTNNGIGFGDLLLVAFIVLKICGVINWSWWWVMSPFWIPLCVAIILLIIYAIIRCHD